MDKKPERILHIIGKLGSGGIESFVINVYRHILKGNIQFDFIVFRDEQEFYEEEIVRHGGKKIVLGKELKSNLSERLKRIFRFFLFLKKHSEYKVIHVHMSNPTSAMEYILVSKLLKRKVIAHSHASGDYRNGKIRAAIYMICRKILDKTVDVSLACSMDAAKWMFLPRHISNVKIIYNGIDFEKFIFRQEIRDRVREQYHLNDIFVIGHVGRFAPEKNHHFLFDIFREIMNKKNAKLLLVGDGDEKKELETRVRQCGLDEKVIFAGECRDISSLMQAMDVFVMPSKYEGFGIVALEAQAAGLPCVLSDNIPKEVECVNNVCFLSLESGVKKWAEEIINIDIKTSRNIVIDKEKKRRYDIRSAAGAIEKIYMGL